MNLPAGRSKNAGCCFTHHPQQAQQASSERMALPVWFAGGRLLPSHAALGRTSSRGCGPARVQPPLCSNCKSGGGAPSLTGVDVRCDLVVGHKGWQGEGVRVCIVLCRAALLHLSDGQLVNVGAALLQAGSQAGRGGGQGEADMRGSEVTLPCWWPKSTTDAASQTHHASAAQRPL